MTTGKPIPLLVVLGILTCFSGTVWANNYVDLIRTPIAIQKSGDLCFQQQGQATTYVISYNFSEDTSGTLWVDGNLMDSFTPTGWRTTQVKGLFKDGIHKITLTVDKAATLTKANITAYGTSGELNLLPVLSCTASGRGSSAGGPSSTNNDALKSINEKLNDLEQRVSALEVKVLGKAKANPQAASSKGAKKETPEEKINALEVEITATLKNLGEWKKEIDALHASAK